MRHLVNRVSRGLLLCAVLLSAAQAAETDRGLIWRIESAGEPSYLVGSIHLAPPSMYPLPATLSAGFAAADALVVEVDVLAADAMRLGRLTAERGIYPAGQSLKDELAPAEWAALERLLARYGYPADFAARQRPWLLQMTLALAAFTAHGFEQNAGVDLHFLQQARRADKPVLELETADAQLAMLFGFTPELQRQMLNHTVRQLLDEELPIAALADFWRRGEADEIAAIVTQDMDAIPAVAEVLLHRRNAAMADRIGRWLKDGRSYFIVAGAAHMLGESGLVEQLRRAGYKVQQL